MNDATHPEFEELNWLAFSYLANELDVQQLVGFEQLLADSQDAREAVAASWELLQMTLAGEDFSAARGADGHTEHTEKIAVKAVTATREWSNRVKWMGMGAALALATLLIVRWTPPHPSRPDGPSSFVDSELALAWNETRSNSSNEFEQIDLEYLAVDAPISFVNSALDAGEDFAGLSDSEGEIALASPSWMLMAISEMSEPDSGEEQGNVSQDES